MQIFFGILGTYLEPNEVLSKEGYAKAATKTNLEPSGLELGDVIYGLHVRRSYYADDWRKGLHQALIIHPHPNNPLLIHATPSSGVECCSWADFSAQYILAGTRRILEPKSPLASSPGTSSALKSVFAAPSPWP